MGYHTAKEIPNYWAYAHDYVLQDHMFAPNLGWSLPAHLAEVSAWSARCTSESPFSCTTAIGSSALGGGPLVAAPYGPRSWTDITYLLHAHHVSWRYYVSDGNQPDCPTGATTCTAGQLSASTPSIWNPLLSFETVHSDHQLRNIQPVSQYFTAARAGKLPAAPGWCPTSATPNIPRRWCRPARRG